MQTTSVNLSPGLNEIPQRLEDFQVGLMEGELLVRIVATVRSHFGEPSGHGIPQPETTLAIRMDRAAAMMLAAKLRDLAQTMDWPLL